MLYESYTIDGELCHYAKGSEKAGAKYIDKVRTKSGKWRYVYKKNYEMGKKLGLIDDKADKIAKKNSSKSNEKLGKELGLIDNKKEDIKSKFDKKGAIAQVVDSAKKRIESDDETKRDTLSEILAKLEKKRNKR